MVYGSCEDSNNDFLRVVDAEIAAPVCAKNIQTRTSSSSSKETSSAISKTMIFLLAVGVIGLTSFAAVNMNNKEPTYAEKAIKFKESMRGSGNGRVTYSLLTDDQKQDLFDDFLIEYSRSYAQDAEEYNKRLNVFKANLDISDTRTEPRQQSMVQLFMELPDSWILLLRNFTGLT